MEQTKKQGKEKKGYLQVADFLSTQIKEKIYPPGSRLPSMKDLSARFQVCNTTIKNAFMMLRNKKLLRYHYGIGMIVREDLRFSLNTALILPSDYQGPGRLLQGMQEAVKGSYGKVELMFYKDAAEQEQCLKRLKEEDFSGAVIRPDLSGNGYAPARKLQDEKFPIVMIENFYPDADWLHVDAGAFDAAKTAVKYLKDIGRVPVAILCADDRFGDAFAEGYKTAHMEMGMECYRCNIKLLENGLCPDAATMQFLKMKNPPHSIIYMHPADAVAGYKALAGNGADMKNIKLVSFGDVPNGELFEYRIISIKRDFKELGFLAGKLLLDHIEMTEDKSHCGQTVKVTPGILSGM